RRPARPAADFVRREASNPLSLPVKRADLEDNLRQAEQAGKKTEKYQRGLDLLRDIKSGS
ncbi:metal-dependent phosphohydrolase, partial [Rhizobium ruizarguesonis]